MVVIKDPIYKLIEIEDEFLSIIDNPYFQRLRNIKQNALLFYVYPSAKHDRFSHSLGTYHLMKQVVNNDKMKLSDKDKFNLKAAALLHDVGHGPYSHLWEHLIPNFNHEEMSANIIREIFGLPEVASIVEKDHPYHKLLSSVIDVDKLDYMVRDSYFCGVGYGNSDMERIVRSLSVEDGKLVIDPKLVSSVEHVITGRISLYKATYFHPACRAKDALMESIFNCAKDLYQSGEDIFVDELLSRFLDQSFNIQDFLHMTDTIVEYHIHVWCSSKNPVLYDLANRFFYRKSFVARDLSLVDSEYVKERKERVAKKYLLPLYFHEDNIVKGVYENEVYVKKPSGELVALSKFSEHIAGIIKTPIKINLVIFPKEFI
ncbi:HD domain-containing protein [Candidatus Woesearchaeota archaeon]|nr:HD domain-containing protein [Candidatus Woesearchaeota archaeon]